MAGLWIAGMAAAVALLVAAALWMVRFRFDSERITMGPALRRNAPGKFVKLSDGVTHYQLMGPASAPTIVLVHGATLPLFVWKDLDRRLSAAGYQVLTYDLFGRGYSDRPWKRYGAELHDRQLVELMDVLGITKASLLGLAFGFPIAAGFASRRPERVEKLIAMAPDGFGVIMSRNAARWYMRVPFLRDYIFSLVGTKILMARLPAYSRNPAIVGELREAYAPTLAWRGFKHAVLSSVRNMPVHDAGTLYAKVALSGIPLAVIWGSDDRVTPYPGEDRLRNTFPAAVLEVLSGAGHLPHYEDLERVFATVAKFLKSGAPRSATDLAARASATAR